MSELQLKKPLEAAIYKGSFWNTPLTEVLAQKPLCTLTQQQVERIEILFSQERHKGVNFSAQGIPDRTLILPNQEIRLIYSGTMGAEIGIRGLYNEEQRDSFYSKEFLQLLVQTEPFLQINLLLIVCVFVGFLMSILVFAIIALAWIYA